MKKWLFNPFELVAGWNSFFLGLGTLFATAVAAYYGHIHLDGVLDLHVSHHLLFSVCILEGLTNWACMVLFIYLAGLCFSRSSIRIIDVLGTQALARFPFLISCLVSLVFFSDKVLQYVEYTLLHKGEPVEVTMLDVVGFGCVALVDVVLLIWAVIWMYRAYSISCNVKGNKGVFSFTGALILAEVLSKILIGCFI